MAASPSSAAAASSTSGSSATPSIDPSAPIRARGAALVGPTGLVFDAAGNLYVSGCSSGPGYIYRIDPHGMMTTFAGVGSASIASVGQTTFGGDGGPAIAADLHCPVGMAFGPDGALYFADHASNRVRRIDAAGIITTVAGSGAAGVDQGSFSGDGGLATKATLQEPWGVAIDHAGNLYIGDRDNYRVRRVDRHGVITTVAGNGQLKFTGDGGLATAAGMCPRDVAFDRAGNLLISDPCNNRVRSVDGHDAISTVIGTGVNGSSGDGGPARKAMVQGPNFLAFDGEDRLFVGDLLRIRRIDPAGVIVTIAGTGRAGVPKDGTPALEAPLPELYGLAVGPAGDVFVSDGTTVYRIDLQGVLMVFAGSSN